MCLYVFWLGILVIDVMIQVSLYFQFVLLGCSCAVLLHDMLDACAPLLIS
ncbi:hypothetical protein Scep_001775 [Stephania cephalantha]|uniref:Uncharacterized protein n=1 Tax=Stephania cephalantha TaxID=152367 RepID=A0AAP0Q5D3_9MAGN